VTVTAGPGAGPRAVTAATAAALTRAGPLALASAAAALTAAAKAEPGRARLAAGAAVAPPVTLTFAVRSASAALSVLRSVHVVLLGRSVTL
jgi:hypothetical protein